jgi:hypothetical protein
VTIATRGYAEHGVGAEVRFGEGIAGVVAEARKPIRISGLLRGMLYAWAMHHPSPNAAAARAAHHMPGLPTPESQLGVPLLVRGELVGVLVLESEIGYRFHEEDKTSIELLGSYLAIAIQNMQLQERAAEAVRRRPHRSPRPSRSWPGLKRRRSNRRAIAILAVSRRRVLRVGRVHPRRHRVPHPRAAGEDPVEAAHARETGGRSEFTNRELRLDKSLNLPEWKDNLESRLLLLRRRLEQKCPDIRILPRARGRFQLEVAGAIALSRRE